MPADPRIVDLVARRDSLRQQGQSPTPEELCRDCPELLDSLRAHLEMLDNSIPPTDVGVGGPASRPPAAGRYLALSLHARGGLGEVFLARDTELNREVALKQMQDHIADNGDLRRRFLLEAEVTGRLEHPGIVPVYGLGADEVGRPYYAMRFIRGESLHDAIKKYHAAPEEFEFRQLLTRFVAVCNAVGYAHSRGIVHRDIKPANVMLGPYGETLVVDWGLARAVARSESDRDAGEETLLPSPDSTPGATRGAVGTPAYMSPEQAGGRAALVGPASDVYSLGATLYALLTSKAPFEKASLDETLEKVQRGEFLPPRIRKPDVSRALEAVCLKAMALKREDRYGSATELASDLDRWLADEPVTAYREPLTKRAARWAKRHRTAVTASVGFLAAAFVALAVGLVVVRHKERVAQAERDRADENFRLAHGALRDTLQAITRDERLKQADTLPARRQLLEVGLPYYEKFVEQRGGDPKLLYERADAYALLGEARENLGQHQRALADYQKALELLDDLLGRDPGRADARLLIPIITNQIGLVWKALGDPARAERSYRDAIQGFGRLNEENPGDAEYRSRRASCWNNFGVVLADTGRNAEAEKAYRDAIADYREVARLRPDSAVARASLASSLNNLSNLLKATTNSKEPDDLIREAIELRARAVKEKPGDPDGRSHLADSHNNAALRLVQLGRAADAKTAYEAAIGLNSKLMAEFPSTPHYRERQAMYLYNFGWLLATLGKPIEAEKELLASRTIASLLVAEFPKVPVYRHSLSATLNDLAYVYEITGRLAEAEKELKTSEGLLVELVRSDPATTIYLRDLAVCRNRLGDAVLKTARFALAEQYHRAALADFQELVKRVPSDENARTNVGAVFHQLHQSLMNQGKLVEAEKAVRESLLIHERLAKEFPAIPRHRENVAASRQSLARFYSDLGQFDKAEQELLAAIETFRLLAKEFNRGEDGSLQLALVLSKLAQTYHRNGKPEKAFSLVDEADAIVLPILIRLPNLQFAVEVALSSACCRADALTQQGKHAEALKAWDEAVRRDNGSAREALGIYRAAALARVDPGRAVEEVERILRGKIRLPHLLFEVAVTCGLAMAKLPAGEARDKAGVLAIEALREGWRAGAFQAESQRAKLTKNPDLKPLRSRADYKKLVAEIDANPKGK